MHAANKHHAQSRHAARCALWDTAAHSRLPAKFGPLPSRARLGQPRAASYTHRLTSGKLCKSACFRRKVAAATKQATQLSAREVVETFYSRYNAGDVDGILDLMADNCQYHDLALYQEPHTGKVEIRKFFENVRQTVPADLTFVLEKVSGDQSCVGVQWHCEIQGHEFPFSRGCSFYELDSSGKIFKARDLVESALKPGSLALQALALLAPVVRKLGPRANPGNLNKLPKTSIALAICTLVYWYLFFASRILPGVPSWEAPPEQYKEILNQSINFWYCNNAFEAAGWPHIPNEAQHPVSEAIFNFAGAYSFMLLPLFIWDRKSKRKVGMWTAILFLTNFLMFPYMALRALPVDKPIEEQGPRPPEVPLPGMSWVPWVPSVGWTSLTVAAMSVWWALCARPEYGGLAERWSFFQEAISNDRAFCVSIADILLYSIWQPVLMAESGWRWRNIPFFGLASWLVNVGVQRQVAAEGLREQQTGIIRDT